MELVLQLIIVVTVEIKHKFSENSVQVESDKRASHPSNELITTYIHLRPPERIRVGYAASVIAKIRSGQEVLIWLQPFGSQTVSDLGTERCYVMFNRNINILTTADMSIA